MKNYVRIFSIFLACCLVFVLTFTSVVAADTVDSKINNASLNEYIDTTLPHYLTLGDEAYDQVKISNPVPIKNHSNRTSRMYFVTNDGEYIGQLIVSFVNNQYYSNFMFDNNVEINNVLKTNIPFALIAYNDGNDHMVMQTASDNMIISANKQNSLERLNIPVYELSPATFSSFNPIQNYTRTSSDYYVSLSVPNVSNDTTPDGKGLCWAACIAAISNYRTDSSYDALDIFDALDYEYSGTPEGTRTWYEYGYEYCGMGYNDTSGMEFIDLYDVLDSGKPAMFDIARSGAAHAIVCKYLMGGNDYTTYGFMDPNRSSTVYTYFDDPNLDPDNFVYDNGQNEYDDWRYTIY
ncbi:MULTISPECIES: hypothetical protein [unclassified Sedimentibacter]|uniref:hypothetical protein n=1 Tax=unclassified Sedimentibacter TaxID=2649220 RepID=UPI0027E20C75|nr:hypothetical protein [Sedimentibacter sp. MB35-C1]WMJ76524.1 hypothetical protein RBQ61_12915 [Sedimentibacter sp. MB35-C1]